MRLPEQTKPVPRGDKELGCSGGLTRGSPQLLWGGVSISKYDCFGHCRQGKHPKKSGCDGKKDCKTDCTAGAENTTC
jgi:hypothetical protein